MADFRKHDPSFSNNTPNIDLLMVLKLGSSDRRTIAGVPKIVGEGWGTAFVALLNWDCCFLASSWESLGQKSDGIKLLLFGLGR